MNDWKVYLLVERPEITIGGFVKVGVTSGPIHRRVQSLQTGNPRPLEVLSAWVCESEQVAFVLERSFLSEMEDSKEHYVKGEWVSTGLCGAFGVEKILLELAKAHGFELVKAQDCWL